MTWITSDAGMYDKDQWTAAQVITGSQNLLKALWNKHPRIMRIAHRDGRAASPREAWDAWERKRASRVEFTCYDEPLPEPPPHVDVIEPEHVYDRRPETGMKLVQCVADDFNISYGELVGDGRSRKYVEARAVVVRVLRMRGWSYPKIARLIGKRDHSTIIHAIDTFDIHAKRNPMVAKLFERYRPEWEVVG